ncbi:MAG: hypothetical protein ABL931_07390 [Usitatibacteraceae bacterium]
MTEAPVSRNRKSKKPPPNPTPHSLLVALQQQYSTRFHMFLIVAASISVAVLTTRLMLTAGVVVMWERYAAALVLAYAAFFAGVWVWLHLSQYGRHLRADWGRRRDWTPDGNIDVLPNINVGGGTGDASGASFGGGGGTFDGGGAGGSWDIPADAASVSVDMPGSGLLDGAGSIGDVGDGEGCLVVIAGILIAIVLAAVFGATIYVVYQAPAILAEVIFEVLLGSPLARGAKALDTANWAAALLKKTWKPFGLMAGAAMLFAFFCNSVYPQAATAGQVIDLMLK